MCRNLAGLIPRSHLSHVVFLRFREAIALIVALFAGVFWSQAMPLLIRPFYTWNGRSPVVNVIEPVQANPWLIGAFAAVAMLIRLVLDNFTNQDEDEVRTLSDQRDQTMVAIGFRAGGRAFLFVFLTAGLLDSWWHAVLYFIGLSLVFVLGSALGHWQKYVDFMNDIPALLKMVLLFFASYWLSLNWIEWLWSSSKGSFYPMIIALLCNCAIAILLFPKLTRLRQTVA